MNIQMLLNLGTARAPDSPGSASSGADTGDNPGFAVAFEQVLRRHAEAPDPAPTPRGLPASLRPVPAPGTLPPLPDTASAIAVLARPSGANGNISTPDPALPPDAGGLAPTGDGMDTAATATALPDTASVTTNPVDDSSPASPAPEAAEDPRQQLSPEPDNAPLAAAVVPAVTATPATDNHTARDRTQPNTPVTPVAPSRVEATAPSPAPPPTAPAPLAASKHSVSGERAPASMAPAATATDTTTAFTSGHTDIASVATAGDSQASRTGPAPQAALTAAVATPQWGQQLGERMVVMARRGEQQMSLQLNPAELGPLNVELRVIDHQAQLHLASASAQVRGAIEQAIPQLREALAEQGISLGDATVNDQRPGDQHPGFGAGRGQSQGESLPADSAPAESPAPQAVALDGRVNLYV